MDDFIEFMGYRNMIIEEKIEECLSAVRQGETEISIDCDDLIDSEAEYLREEVLRRIEHGNY